MPKSHIIKALKASVHRVTLRINKALKVRSLTSRKLSRGPRNMRRMQIPPSRSERIVGKEAYTQDNSHMNKIPIKIVCIIVNKGPSKCIISVYLAGS